MTRERKAAAHERKGMAAAAAARVRKGTAAAPSSGVGSGPGGAAATPGSGPGSGPSAALLSTDGNGRDASPQQVPPLRLRLPIPRLPHRLRPPLLPRRRLLRPPPPPRSHGQPSRVAVLAAVFCASVVAGNVSLSYLPVSFNQAVSATMPFFNAVLAYAVAMIREACATYAALIPVVAGVVVATGGEPSFHLFGFIMCVGAATAGRVLKTVLQGILMSSEEEKLNSMDLRYIAPVAVILLVPATLIMEREVLGMVATLAWEDPNFICNSSLAYFVNLTNFLVTKHTSPLTLQVLGNAKAAVAVVVSILIFRNPVPFVGMLGYGITVTGVVLYGEAKKRNK